MEAAVGRFHRRALTQQQDPAVNLELTIQVAPRGGHHSHHGFVGLGAFGTKKLRVKSFSTLGTRFPPFRSRQRRTKNRVVIG